VQRARHDRCSSWGPSIFSLKRSNGKEYQGGEGDRRNGTKQATTPAKTPNRHEVSNGLTGSSKWCPTLPQHLCFTRLRVFAWTVTSRNLRQGLLSVLRVSHYGLNRRMSLSQMSLTAPTVHMSTSRRIEIDRRTQYRCRKTAISEWKNVPAKGGGFETDVRWLSRSREGKVCRSHKTFGRKKQDTACMPRRVEVRRGCRMQFVLCEDTCAQHFVGRMVAFAFSVTRIGRREATRDIAALLLARGSWAKPELRADVRVFSHPAEWRPMRICLQTEWRIGVRSRKKRVPKGWREKIRTRCGQGRWQI